MRATCGPGVNGANTFINTAALRCVIPTLEEMKNVIYNLRCWFFGWLVFAFSFGAITAFAQSGGSLSPPNCSLSYSFSYNEATGLVTVTIGVAGTSPWYPEYGVIGSGGATYSGVGSPGWGAAGGTFTLSPSPGVGTVLTILANGRNGATGAGTDSVSASWTVGAPPPPQKQVTVSLRNTRDVPVTYKLYQDGEQIGEITLQPGQALIQQFNVPAGSDVTVFESVVGVSFDGQNWVENSSAVTTKKVAEGITPHDEGAAPAVPPSVPQSPDIPQKVSPTPRPSGAPVWRSVPVELDPTQQKDLLTNAIYREGVDKLIAFQTERDEGGQKAAETVIAEGLVKGGEASAAVVGLFADNAGATGEPPAISDGSAPDFSISLPPRMGGVTINVDPFRSDRFAAVVAWFRKAVAWLAIVLLGIWVWREIAEWTRGVSTVTPVKSNLASAVPGTGVAGALAVATLMTTATVVLFTSLLSFVFGDVTLAWITDAAFANPTTEMPATALYMLNKVFPVATLITCLLARLAFNFYAAPLYAGYVSLCRFFVG